MTQTEKALRFQELHRRPGAFLLPNPWDAGSARIFPDSGLKPSPPRAGPRLQPSVGAMASSRVTTRSQVRAPSQMQQTFRCRRFWRTGSATGVKRISFASSLYRAAMTGLVEAASEARQSGSFGYLDKAITTAELNKFLPE